MGIYDHMRKLHVDVAQGVTRTSGPHGAKRAVLVFTLDSTGEDDRHPILSHLGETVVFTDEDDPNILASRISWGGFRSGGWRQELVVHHEEIRPLPTETGEWYDYWAYCQSKGLYEFKIVARNFSRRYVAGIDASGDVYEVHNIDQEHRILAEEAGVNYDAALAVWEADLARAKASAAAIDRELPPLRWSKSARENGAQVRARFVLEHPHWRDFAEGVDDPAFWEMTTKADLRSYFSQFVRANPTEENLTLLARAETGDVLSTHGEIVVSPLMLDRFSRFEHGGLYVAQVIASAAAHRAQIKYTKPWFPEMFFETLGGSTERQTAYTRPMGEVLRVRTVQTTPTAEVIPYPGNKYRTPIRSLPTSAFAGERVLIVDKDNGTYSGLVEGLMGRYVFPPDAFEPLMG